MTTITELPYTEYTFTRFDEGVGAPGEYNAVFTKPDTSEHAEQMFHLPDWLFLRGDSSYMLIRPPADAQAEGWEEAKNPGAP